MKCYKNFAVIFVTVMTFSCCSGGHCGEKKEWQKKSAGVLLEGAKQYCNIKIKVINNNPHTVRIKGVELGGYQRSEKTLSIDTLKPGEWLEFKSGEDQGFYILDLKGVVVGFLPATP